MYTERLNHIQQRVSTILSLTQKRGITTWIVAGIIYGIFELFLKKEMPSSTFNIVHFFEALICLLSLIITILYLGGYLTGFYFLRPKSRNIIPPAKLTMHITSNWIAAIVNVILIISSLVVILNGAISISKVLLWLSLMQNSLFLAITVRAELVKSAEEVLPGLHGDSWKSLTQLNVFPKLRWSKYAVLLTILTVILSTIPFLTFLQLIREPRFSGFPNLFTPTVFLPLLAVVTLSIYAIIRESDHREIRSLHVLEKLMLRFPDIDDNEFGLLLHACRWQTSFISYAQFLMSFNQRQFMFVAEYYFEYMNLKSVENPDEEPDHPGRLFSSHAKFYLAAIKYQEYCVPLLKVLKKYIPSATGPDWQYLLDLELEREKQLNEFIAQAVDA